MRLPLIRIHTRTERAKRNMAPSKALRDFERAYTAKNKDSHIYL